MLELFGGATVTEVTEVETESSEKSVSYLFFTGLPRALRTITIVLDLKLDLAW